MLQVRATSRSAFLLLLLSLPWKSHLQALQPPAHNLTMSDVARVHGPNGVHPPNSRRTTIVKIIRLSTNSTKEIVVEPNRSLSKSLTTTERRILTKLGLIDSIDGERRNVSTTKSSLASPAGRKVHFKVPNSISDYVMPKSWQFLNLGGGVFKDTAPTNQER